MIERQYNQLDLRLLKSLRAPLDDELFKEMYEHKQDIWARAFPTGAMPNGNLLDLVEDFERERARRQARAVEPSKNGKPKKEPVA